MTSILDHLLKLIGCSVPLQTAPHGQRLWVDQIPVDISEDKNGLMLWSSLGNASTDPSKRLNELQQLAWIATARSGEEDWVLSYEASTRELFVWGKLDANASDETLTESLESFVSSVEWWSHRLQEDENRVHRYANPASSQSWEDSGLMMFRP